MAKKATKNETSETNTAEAPAPAIGAPKNDTFQRVFGPDGTPIAPSVKLAPQAQCIMNTLEAAGKDGLKRADLCTALTGVLVTRQPVGRIVSYYQKALVNSGAVRIVG